MQTSFQKAMKNGRPVVHGRRSEDRIHVLLRAVATIGGERVALRINDISSKGAMICTEHGLERGEELSLSVGPVEVVATVAWAGTPYYGLCFHRPIILDSILPDATRKMH
jgi:hypothetical protein